MVDFISFSSRAWRLTRGEDLFHGLYPVGYPALLAVGHGLLGDVLVAGKVISTIAAIGVVLATARWLGAAAGRQSIPAAARAALTLLVQTHTSY